MAPPVKPPLSLEQRILSELAEIGAKIQRLTADRAALEDFLGRVRRDNLGSKDVTRKNSYTRIVVENRILEALDHEKRPASARLLFTTAQLVAYGLKPQTFRSYLHRLKERGLIAPSARRGYWERAKKN